MAAHVLEFGLGDETYCVDVANVEEIVERGALTDLPRSDRHVEGVMDLRGETLPVVDPKIVLGLDGEAAAERVVVLDLDGDRHGWLVDEAREVYRADGEDLEEADDDYLRGVLRRDGELILWLDDEALAAADAAIEAPAAGADG